MQSLLLVLVLSALEVEVLRWWLIVSELVEFSAFYLIDDLEQSLLSDTIRFRRLSVVKSLFVNQYVDFTVTCGPELVCLLVIFWRLLKFIPDKLDLVFRIDFARTSLTIERSSSVRVSVIGLF